jgi:predicted dehydrogenase
MPIEIALLGCGHPHVPDVLGVIAAEPDLRLAAAWDPAGVPGAIAAHAVTELDAAIRRADAVVVCAPTDQRVMICARAAQAGRPILVETPIALTAREARRLAQEVARSRTPARAVLFLRELPALHRLRAVLRSDLLGRPASVEATFGQPATLDGRLGGPAAWMRDPRRAGAGGFGQPAVQLLDALAVLGRPPRLDALVRDRDTAQGSEVGGAAVGRWGGTPLVVRASWAAAPGGLRIALDGATGSARIHDGSLELIGADGRVERWVGAPPDPGEAVRSFAGALRARRLEPPGLEPAIRAQQLIERAATID